MIFLKSIFSIIFSILYSTSSISNSGFSTPKMLFLIILMFLFSLTMPSIIYSVISNSSYLNLVTFLTSNSIFLASLSFIPQIIIVSLSFGYQLLKPHFIYLICFLRCLSIIALVQILFQSTSILLSQFFLIDIEVKRLPL